MKVAYFSPLPPSTSGIADYSALLLPALEQLVDVEVVRPGRTRPVADADISLYHVGNDPDAHGWILDALRRRSGVVVLHDFVLHHLLAGATIGRNDGHAYLAAMEREAGAAGRMLGWGVLEGRVPPLWEVRPTEFPLVGEILDRATALIVHSHYVEARVRERGYEGPLWHIPHPAWPAEDVTPARVEGSPLFGCFGHINANKRVPQLLRAFATFQRTHPDARLLLVGEEAPGYRLLEELPPGVIREPYVEEERLMSLMAACDAVVLLRAPTMGETSGSAIRTLSLGKPLVVSDLGWFGELPDDVAIKVAVGDGEEAALAAALGRLADPAVAARMGEAAHVYVHREHDVRHVAELYVSALEQAAGSAAVDERVLGEVAAAAADTGIEPELLAPDLRELGLSGHDPVTVTGRRFPTGPTWLWLAALYAVAVAAYVPVALRVTTPWIMFDEVAYGELARSFARVGRFLVRGHTENFGYVYEFFVSIPYALTTHVADAYLWTRVVNVLVMASVIVPVYLLARRVVRPGSAFAAAALAVIVPPMAYTSALMTENAFYPVFCWLALAFVAALERPTARNQLLMLGACVVAYFTRTQAVALFGAALTAPLALAWIERGRPRRLGAFKPLYGATAAIALLIVVFEAARGHGPLHLLGGHSDAGTAHYKVGAIVQWTILHLAGLDLALFVLPAAAFVVVVASARHLDRPLRVYAAVSATLVVWMTLEVAIFASHFSRRIEERNLFYVMPLFLIALLAWIERGQPRPSRAGVAAGLIAAVLPLSIPFVSLMNQNAESDTPFLQPWWYLGDKVVGRSAVSIVVAVTVFLLAAAFFWLSPRFAPALPVVVALGFLLTWIPLETWQFGWPSNARAALAAGLPAQRDWIDAAAGRDAKVAILWSGQNPYRAWENEFWNESIRNVYNLNGEILDFGWPQTPVVPDTATGVLRDKDGKPIDADYVLTDTRVKLVGRLVASDAAHHLALYGVQRPARVSTQILGWFPDNWTTDRVRWVHQQCTGGTLRVVVLTDPRLFHGIQQHVAVGGTTAPQDVLVPMNGSPRTIVAPLTPKNGTCVVTLHVTPSRIPAHYPSLNNGDTRLLGVHAASFTYRP